MGQPSQLAFAQTKGFRGKGFSRGGWAFLHYAFSSPDAPGARSNG